MNETRQHHAVPAAIALGAALATLAACGGYPADPGAHGGPSPARPSIERFTAETPTTFVGERARLTAVFAGDSAAIDGIGPVRSGATVETPALARATTFVLTVRAGAESVEARLTVPVGYRGRLRTLVPSPVARARHLALPLPDGGALVFGGNTSETVNVPDSDTSQRFDPATERFSEGPALAFPALSEFTAAVAAPGGELVLVGGGPNSPLGRARSRASQALGAGGAFVRGGDLELDHGSGGVATALPDGRVLVTGGDVPAVRAVEVRAPEGGLWGETGLMQLGRRGHTATALPDGRVLVVGGLRCCVLGVEVFTDSAELYDPVEVSTSPTGSLHVARGFHAATLLADGRVLVSGGLAGRAGSRLGSAEIWDPATGQFGPVGAMRMPRTKHLATLLADGRVLVVGGQDETAETDLFDPATGRWEAGPVLPAPLRDPTATLLSNGKVLVFGGEDAAGFPLATASLFE